MYSIYAISRNISGFSFSYGIIFHWDAFNIDQWFYASAVNSKLQKRKLVCTLSKIFILSIYRIYVYNYNHYNNSCIIRLSKNLR